MQGLADGYFVIPYTIGHYLASTHAAEGHDRSRRVQGSGRQRAGADQPAAVGQGQRAASARFHRELGRIMWDDVGMARTEAGLTQRARRRFRSCATSSGSDVSVPGDARQPEPEPRVRRPRRRLPRVRRAAGARRAATAANRAAATSARRARRPTARRCATTTNFSYVAAWEFTGVGKRAGAAQGAARVRGSASDAAELQVGDGLEA